MSKNNPAISVIIPVYNGEKTIAECISAVFNSTFNDFEIIVVNDGSTDNTLDILRRFPIRIYSQDNQGPASARNLGADKAKSDILFFLDADVILEPSSLLIAIEAFKDPQVNIVNGIYHKTPANPSFITEYKALFEYYCFTVEEKSDEYKVFLGRCAGIRKSAFEKVNGYDTKYTFASVEQEELGFRLSKFFNLKLEPGIQGKHYFPYWGKLIKMYFLRTADWIELFYQKKEFDTAITTKCMCISNLNGAIYVGSLFLTLYYPPFIFISKIFLAVFFYGYYKMLFFMYKEKGYIFCIKALGTALALSCIISLAAFHGSIIYLKGNYGKRKSIT